MEFFNDHRKLFWATFGLFAFLTLFVAIIPALHNQQISRPLPGTEAPTADEIAGKAVYIANGCVACHTQQVRNVEMDTVWGSRPSIAADYARNFRTDFWRNTATVMGTERTGPDLTNIGVRQPSVDWHLLHLYNPRIVVEQSIMPAYPWLFTIKQTPASGDVVLNVPEAYMKGKKGKVVATKEALQLVAYMQSLKQTELPTGTIAPEFLYRREVKQTPEGINAEPNAPNGTQLYATHCQACHQANGEGLPGAFPSLKGSKIVLADDPEIFIDIIMNGYSGRVDEGYGIMPPVGSNANLTPEEVNAIVNHERTSWGNQAEGISLDDVKRIMEAVKVKTP